MTINITSKTLKFLIILAIIVTLLMLSCTPLVLTAFLKSAYSTINPKLVIIISACIYLCSMPYIIALFKLKSLSNLVIKNTPFSTNTSKLLKSIAFCAFFELLLFNGCSLYLVYFHNLFLYAFTVMSMIIVSFICLAISFLCLVLSNVFEEATEIKNENDATI